MVYVWDGIQNDAESEWEWREREPCFLFPQKAGGTSLLSLHNANPLSALSTSKPSNQEHKESDGGCCELEAIVNYQTVTLASMHYTELRQPRQLTHLIEVWKTIVKEECKGAK